ncbi:MAG: hypothetical protein R6V32_10305 [Bacteroidales bacterium]
MMVKLKVFYEEKTKKEQNLERHIWLDMTLKTAGIPQGRYRPEAEIIILHGMFFMLPKKN